MSPSTPDLASVHLVGIGGAGMSGIARILLARGANVSGSDAKDSRSLQALAALGARVQVGHSAASVRPGLTAVVVSSAIATDNVEVLAARSAGVPVVHRAEVLARLMADRRAVAVAGTHGKTTTTSMLVQALMACGADPSFAIGGDLNEPGSNAHQGGGELFVAEADESDGSFLQLVPEIAVVTNVEADHLDHYGTAERVEQAFEQFVLAVPDHGWLVACADDPGSRRLADQARAAGRQVRTYGELPGADLVLVGLRTGSGSGTAEVGLHDEPVGRLEVAVPGRHNVLNAAAALAAGLLLDQPADRLLDGLAGYRGVRRRFELKGTAGGVRVYDDYAHHPTEIRATLGAAREVAGGGRVIAAFQPHRYSRTQAFGPELGRALGLADAVLVLEVYAAGEEPIPGAGGLSVAQAVPLAPDRVRFEPSFSAVAAGLAAWARSGDLVLTLGAGDVTQVGPEVLVALGGG